MPERYDVLIVGAGPAGITTALKLASSGLKIAIVDKARFPREKTCGDGLTLDVINQLPLVSEALAAAFHDFPRKQASHELVVFSPALSRFTLPFRMKKENSPIYTCRRVDFDNLMFGQLKQHKNIHVYENCKALKVELSSESVVLTTDSNKLEARLIVGSDGANSLIARQMGIRRIPKKQLAVGLTAYYSGLQPLGDKNPVEMYFFRDILPGYLWIFHLGNGTANVGLAMLSSSITNKGIDLKKKFGELLSGEPLKTRFLTARREGEIKSRILPLGFDKRAISGERFLLTGDAAGLTEPLTGEGVGNALRSGRVASEHILSAFNSNNFSATFNKAYDNEIYRRVMPDFKMNNRLQKLIGHPFLLNFITGSIHKHEDLEKAFNNALIHLQQPSAKSKLLFILKTAYIFTLLKLSKDILTVGTKYFNRKSPDQKEKKNV